MKLSNLVSMKYSPIKELFFVLVIATVILSIIVIFDRNTTDAVPIKIDSSKMELVSSKEIEMSISDRNYQS